MLIFVTEKDKNVMENALKSYIKYLKNNNPTMVDYIKGYQYQLEHTSKMGIDLLLLEVAEHVKIDEIMEELIEIISVALDNPYDDYYIDLFRIK